MMPTRPTLSRKATNFSPSSMSRIGGPSAISSAEPQAGIQYSRKSRPIIVPGPTPASSSKSCSDAISRSLPQRRDPVAGCWSAENGWRRLLRQPCARRRGIGGGSARREFLGDGRAGQRFASLVQRVDGPLIRMLPGGRAGTLIREGAAAHLGLSGVSDGAAAVGKTRRVQVLHGEAQPLGAGGYAAQREGRRLRIKAGRGALPGEIDTEGR